MASHVTALSIEMDQNQEFDAVGLSREDSPQIQSLTGAGRILLVAW